jgi:hypothetical protein
MSLSEPSNLRKPDLSPIHNGNLSIVGFDLHLRSAVGPGRHLRGRCTCARSGPVDPEWWLSRGWKDRLLSDLEARLRCPCGRRQVFLEIAIGPVRPGVTFYFLP